VDDDWFLKPGSECDLSVENVWSAGSEPALGFEHCWEDVEGRDVDLSRSFGIDDGFPDAFDSSYSNYHEEPNFMVSSTEPQLEPFPTFPGPPQILPLLDEAAALTDGMMLQANHQDLLQQDNSPVGLPSPVDAFLAYGLQSSSPLNEEHQSSDFTGINYQSPLHRSTVSSSATSEELKTPSETSLAGVQCDFEGCGRVCKDHGSLRHHRRHHIRLFSCREEGCASTVNRFSTRRDLSRHQASAHRKESRHCPHCQIKFNGTRLDNLKRHIRKFHSTI